MTTTREVGTCAACGGPVLFDGEKATCPCGQAAIPKEFLNFARKCGPEPPRRSPEEERARRAAAVE
jgi:hypothetical protein